ncbi:MAG: hypothetical protein ACLPUG_00110 [Acidimicrobiales bacterium]
MRTQGRRALADAQLRRRDVRPRRRSNALLPDIVGDCRALREDPRYAGQTIALGPLQTPGSVADASAFLCSPLASYRTGSTFRLQGGCSLGPL